MFLTTTVLTIHATIVDVIETFSDKLGHARIKIATYIAMPEFGKKS